MLDYIKIRTGRIQTYPIDTFFSLNPNTKRQILQKDHYGTLQIFFFPNQIKLSASYFEKSICPRCSEQIKIEIENP